MVLPPISSFGLIPMVPGKWACETLEVCVSVVGDSYEDVRCHPRGLTEGLLKGQLRNSSRVN